MALSVLEIGIGAAIVTLGIVAVSTTGFATNRLVHESIDRSAARFALESLHDDIVAASERLTAEPTTWGQELVDRFHSPVLRRVPGLDPWPAADGIIRVEVVTDETRTDADLGVMLGMPRDLDRDGAASNVDATLGARLLPVVLTARWETAGVRRELVRAFYVQAL